MEKFLLSLIYGVKEIPKNKSDIYNKLKSLNALDYIKDSTKNIIKLKSGFFIGYVDIVENNKGKVYFLKTLNPLPKDPKVIINSRILHNDLIIAKADSRVDSKARRLRVKLVEILQREVLKAIGILKLHKNAYKIFNLKTNKQIDIKVSQKSLKSLPPNCLFEIDLTNKMILNVIGTMNEAKYDLQIALKSYNKNNEFNNEILDFCNSFDGVIEPKYYPKRVDLTHLPFVTIDPNDAKDFDDAIYFDKHYIYVAIADVSYYVSTNSIIDKEAFNRGFSMYFPNIVVPMLPPILSQNLCSLREKECRLAFIWKLKINKKTFQITQSELFEGIIKVAKNLTYDEVEYILDENNSNNMLVSLFSITSKIRNHRLKNGFDFINEEIKLDLDDDFEICNISQKTELKSHKMVEECMLLANKQSAKMMLDSTNVGIFRTHKQISDENLNSLFSDLYFLNAKKAKTPHKSILNLQKNVSNSGESIANLAQFVDKAIISYMPKATYSPLNLGHFALGFDYYTHFTSPIRRYSDLFTHRILKEIINQNSKKLAFLLTHLEAVCARMNVLEKEISKIEYEFNDRKFARYFAKRIGLVLKCVVMDCDSKYECKAKILGTNARIFLDKSYKKFSILNVKIISSNIENLRIEGKVVARLF
ncbi:hypothetical protein CCY99_01150 [Helicobacter sp. 16-1353]|uniref:RNB domain-containing ribonuclease n=1 Tax=Helicobacter sp. 16-1353 TaxID=2004996 RepID=UPI000DCEC523|nr:ribonuclease R family protein [Helicobacter sp. 16-1353]RAX55334.1 hypothetical protein CCY99_01150 [Helicobacter sp. 16-1353]